MTRENAIREIADILELNEDEVTMDLRLKSLETWDSIAILSIISVVSENTGRFLHASEIEKLETVQDLMSLFGD